VLRQIKSFVIRNCHASRLGGMLHLDMRAAGFVNVEAALLESANNLFGFEVRKLGRYGDGLNSNL
jgi:hypothetical protein